MVNFKESKIIEKVEEDIEKKEKESHLTLIKTDDKDYNPLDKKEFVETKKDVKEIKTLLYLLCAENLQIEVPQNIPALLLPKKTRKQKITNIEEKFENLVKRWKEETAFASTVLEMTTHPAYQQIIVIGPNDIHLILNKLSEKPDHWFWALKAITCEDPVPENSRGDLNEMAKAWIDWGKEKGYEL